MPDDAITRLTGTSYAVLGLVDAWGPCTPYDLKRAIETTVVNFWPVPHTTFYVEPARLADAGLLAVEQEESGRRRKLYSVTEAGRAALRAWVGEPTAAPPQLRDELMLKLFLGADPGPLREERLVFYGEKLSELEGYLEVVRAGEGTSGMERSLIAGIAYHRALIAMLEELPPAA
jgi:DNA-binding PadR family transcriptional regulator